VKYGLMVSVSGLSVSSTNGDSSLLSCRSSWSFPNNTTPGSSPLSPNTSKHFWLRTPTVPLADNANTAVSSASITPSLSTSAIELGGGEGELRDGDGLGVSRSGCGAGEPGGSGEAEADVSETGGVGVLVASETDDDDVGTGGSSRNETSCSLRRIGPVDDLRPTSRREIV
jgi:hypothetical protein